MYKIRILILDHNLDGTPLFLGKLTQRGSEMRHLGHLVSLYAHNKDNIPSEEFMTLPHTTLRRFNYITVAIFGLSTKCVSQLRTHATRLSFMSTSTQYSQFVDNKDRYTVPVGVTRSQGDRIMQAYDAIHKVYEELLSEGLDCDKAGYLLPQGLRKALVVSGPLDAWEYVMRTRLCRRNTEETQYVMKLIYNEIPAAYRVNMLPECCKEGKFSCGKPITKEEAETWLLE